MTEVHASFQKDVVNANESEFSVRCLIIPFLQAPSLSLRSSILVFNLMSRILRLTSKKVKASIFAKWVPCIADTGENVMEGQFSIPKVLLSLKKLIPFHSLEN